MDLEYLTKLSENNDEIDLQSFKNILKRNFIKIISITFGFLGTTIIFNETRVPTWQGEFQIVLTNEDDSNSSSLNRFLQTSGGRTFGNIIGLPKGTGVSSKLLTEVEILKSPYALMDNFKDFKKRRKLYQKKSQKLNFKEWLDNNLDIFLIEDTNVLRIALRDNNKENIIETLNGISKTYQKYSKQSKIDSLKNSVNYIENQINQYEIKLDQSLIESENYAKERNLTAGQIELVFQKERAFDETTTFVENYPGLGFGGARGSGVLGPELPIKKKRPKVKSINLDSTYNIIIYEDQIEQIKKIENNPEKLVLLELDPILYKKAEDLRDNINSIFFAREKYKENDITITKLKDSQKILVKKFKKDALDYLNSQIKLSLEKQEQVSNASGSLNQYKSLIRKVDRNESILQSLEDRLIILKLEQARNQNPWKQITKPTLLDEPIGPKKLRNILLSIIFGLIASFSFIYMINKLKGLILSNSSFEKRMNFKKLFITSHTKDNNLKSNLAAISKNINSNNEIKSLNIISFGEVAYDFLSEIKETLKKLKVESKLINENELINLNDSSHLIIVVELFKTKKEEIETLSNMINNLNINVYGYIIIE